MEDTDHATEELIRRAEALEEAGSKREALACWRSLIKRRDDPTTLCRYGDVAVDLEEWSIAEDAYSSAIRLAPGWAGPYEALGALYMKRNDCGDLERAEESFEKSLELERTAHCYTFLGVAQERLDKRTLARESYVAALQIDPEYEEAYYNLGVTYREEDALKAIALFEKAVAIDPKYQAAHRELGWALRLLNKYRDAEYHIRLAIELDGSDGWAHIYLGNLLWGKGELTLAEELFLRATEVWPDRAVPHFCLALFYDRMDRPQEADLFYEKALRLNPDDPQANMRFGLYLRDTGHTETAKSYLERAIALEPGNERVRLALTELDDSLPANGEIHKIH